MSQPPTILNPRPSLPRSISIKVSSDTFILAVLGLNIWRGGGVVGDFSIFFGCCCCLRACGEGFEEDETLIGLSMMLNIRKSIFLNENKQKKKRIADLLH